MSIPRGMPTNSGQTTSRGTYRGNPKCTYSPRLECTDVPMSEPGRSSSAIAVEKKISDQDLGQSKTEHLRIPNFLECQCFTNEAKSASNAARDGHPNEMVVLIVRGISHILAEDLNKEQIRAVQFLQHRTRGHPVTAPSSNPNEVLDFKCRADIKATTTSSLGASKVQLSEDKPGREIIVGPTSHNPATYKLTVQRNNVVMCMDQNLHKLKSNYNQMLNNKKSFLERCAENDAEDKPGREIIVCPTYHNAATYHLTTKRKNIVMRMDQKLYEFQSNYIRMLNNKRRFLERWAKNDEKEAGAQQQAKAASEATKASLAPAAECGKPTTVQVAVDTPPSPRTAPATTFPKTASKAVQTEVEKPKQIPNKETPENVNISTFGSFAHSPSCTSVTSSVQDLEFSNMIFPRNLETENFTVQSANVLSNNVVIQMEHNESSVSDNSQQTDAQGFEDAAG